MVPMTLSSAAASTLVSASAASDTGLVRLVNEDSYLAAAPMFLVADGMGGHSAGDKASQATRDTLAAAVADGEATTPAAVLEAIRRSNEVVREIPGTDNVGRSICGTTLAGLALVRAGHYDRLHWMAFNVGDSRIYSWDGRSLLQLSVDHSAVAELVEAGLISAEQAEVHPDRNIITRAIGASENVEADVWLLPAKGSQSFLLCSDGLTREVDDENIARILAESESDPDVAAQALVDAALAAGGRDNVTVVVLQSTTVADNDDDSLGDLEDTVPRP